MKSVCQHNIALIKQKYINAETESVRACVAKMPIAFQMIVAFSSAKNQRKDVNK
jgi:hypothetical protein